MGLVTNKVEREELKPGDHIYTYRAVFTYSHHGIFLGGCKVVHFRPERNLNSPLKSSSSSSSSDLYDSHEAHCSYSPDCGFRHPNTGVILSCLNCFLNNGYLYRFEYGVSPSVFLTKVRGGTCSTAQSDPPETVIHRAMYLLQKGFGNYDIFQNNCEDFTLYCKTGLLIMDKLSIGRSGQASSMVGAPLAVLLSSPFKLLIPSRVCWCRLSSVAGGGADRRDGGGADRSQDGGGADRSQDGGGSRERRTHRRAHGRTNQRKRRTDRSSCDGGRTHGKLDGGGQ